jgi:hypothetical protein
MIAFIFGAVIGAVAGIVGFVWFKSRKLSDGA